MDKIFIIIGFFAILVLIICVFFIFWTVIQFDLNLVRFTLLEAFLYAVYKLFHWLFVKKN